MNLRVQLMESEKRAYDIFNQFNDEKRFNISCSIKPPTGSHLDRQICQPEFVIQANRGHAQDFLDSMAGAHSIPNGSVAPTHASMEFEILRQQGAYKQKIKKMAQEHPEFLEAIIQYAE